MQRRRMERVTYEYGMSVHTQQKTVKADVRREILVEIIEIAFHIEICREW